MRRVTVGVLDQGLTAWPGVPSGGADSQGEWWKYPTDVEVLLSSGRSGFLVWWADERRGQGGALGVGGTARAKVQSFDGPVRLIFEGWVPHNR